MKKVFIAILFIISFIAAFFITRHFESKETPLPEPGPEIPDSIIITDDTTAIDTSAVNIINIKNETEGNKIVDNKKVETLSESEQKPKLISCSEVKQLIMNGDYVKDKRISKNYTVEYDDLNDDDADIQNNLQAVLDMVDYGNWNDFEVIALGYDNQGRVNKVTIRPVY